MARKGFLAGIKKGALRKKAKARGLIKGDQKLSSGDLGILSNSVDALTRKQATLAKNMKSWNS